MKKALALILIPVMLLALTTCGESIESNPPQNDPSERSSMSESEITQNEVESVAQLKPESMTSEEESIAMQNICITVGSSVFSAKLYDNSAVRAFLAQFPLTLNMSALNSNEKYYYLADDLPSESAENPATMNAGDLMCWSDNCLVLFYKSFSNSYGGYVRLGYVEDASGLAAALGNGNVEVIFAASN